MMHLYTVEAFAALDLSKSFSTGIKNPILTIYRLIHRNQIIDYCNFYNLEMYWQIMQFIHEFIMNLLNYTVHYTFILIYINLANLEFIKLIEFNEFKE